MNLLAAVCGPEHVNPALRQPLQAEANNTIGICMWQLIGGTLPLGWIHKQHLVFFLFFFVRDVGLELLQARPDICFKFTVLCFSP